MPLKQYDQIELRPEYQGTLGHQDAIQQDRSRTPGKDEVAQYIVDDVIQDGRWPMNATDLADEVEYSRQHVSNVLADYFVGVEEDQQGQTQQSRSQASSDSKPFSASPSQLGEQSQSQSGQSQDLPDDVETVFARASNGMVEVPIPHDVENRASYVHGFVNCLEQQ